MSGAGGTGGGGKGRAQAQDYYTLSRAGITHLKDSSSDFTALDRWEREYALFHHIRRCLGTCLTLTAERWISGVLFV